MDKLMVTKEQVQAVERNLIRHKGGQTLPDYEIVEPCTAEPISGWFRIDFSLYIYIDVNGRCHS